jgi:tetratricopeptide (TPR) repeat protein
MSWLGALLKVVVIGIILYQVLIVVRAVAFGRRVRRAAGRGDPLTAVRLSREDVQAKIRRLGPQFPFRLLSLAQIVFASGRVEEAIDWFRVADESTGADFRPKPAILMGLARSLATAGRYPEAESTLARAKELGAPKFRRPVATMRGFVAMQSERFQDARAWYEAAQRTRGTPSRNERLAVLNNLAAANTELGQLDDADRYVDQTQKLAGADAWQGKDYFLGTRGALRLAQGRLAEARADFAQVLTLRGDDPRTLLCLAQLAQKEGKLEDAIGYLDRIQVDPKEALWRRRLAEMLEGLAESAHGVGRTEAAEELRAHANTLRTEVPRRDRVSDDPLLTAVQSALDGRRFTRPSSFGHLALGLYLSACLWLGIFILLPLDPSPTALLVEAVLIVLLTLAYLPLRRWLFGPRRVSGVRLPSKVKSPG